MANQQVSGGQTIATKGQEIASSLQGALAWRCIGPFRGGRAVAVAGHPTEPLVFYMGCAGGVWKTADGGAYWENISDGFFKTSAVGALAVSESDPNVIYVGMGESCTAVPRLHWTSRADGVYKSTDGGKTWTNVGLRDTRHISRIRIHPKDPDLVYVGVLGHLEEPDGQKGVYRSSDGGKTWEHVLFRSEKAGSNDLSMDPNNPRVLYAAIWETKRSYWNTYSGGPDTSLYKTADGGDTWTELTNNPGMTKGIKGRFAVAASPAKAGRVYALFDLGDAPGTSQMAKREDGKDDETGGLYGSDDGGATWERLSDDPELTVRPHYYNHVFADPQDPETVYVLNQPFWKSIDGGRTYIRVQMPHNDNHDLWIDPRNPLRVINGNDGGACVSFDGGATWSTIYNQPTAEFYHVTTDNEVPYRVYATQQDNSAISVPSRSNRGAIRWSDCYAVGSSESGHLVVRPDNPNIVISGALGSSAGAGATMLRYDHTTSQARIITVLPDLTGLMATDRTYRFEWDNPIVISPHDPNVLYSAANVVFRSTDEGASWQVISPDLTRNELEEREDIDPITNIAPFERCAISRFAESMHEPGVFWVGTSDGLVHISRDGSASWENVTPNDLPDWTPISSIDLSAHDPATAYVAANRYQDGDYRPYLFRTHDYGNTWEKITNGIAEIDHTRVLREDPSRKGLLYAGTEGGVYVSFDDGASWQPLQGNLPPAPIHDMVVKDGDLVAATHGRSLWILDDLTPLHQFSDQVVDSLVHLFEPRPGYRYITESFEYREPPPGPDKIYMLGLGSAATYRLGETPEGQIVRTHLDSANNPPDGVVVSYYLKEKPDGEASLTFLDANGQIIKSFSSGEEAGPRIPLRAGVNRFVWDMRYPGLHQVQKEMRTLRPVGDPLAPPGTYQVRLTVGGRTYNESFEVRKDPRVPASQEDLDAQFELLIKIRDKVLESKDASTRVRSVQQQVDAWVRRAEGSSASKTVAEAAAALTEKVSGVEAELDGARGHRRGTFFTEGLIARLTSLTATVWNADAVPTQQSYEVFDDLSGRIDAQIGRVREIVDKDVEAFTSVVRELDIPAIVSEAD